MKKKLDWDLYKIDDNMVQIDDSALKGVSISEIPEDITIAVEFTKGYKDYELEIVKADDVTVDVYLTHIFSNKYFAVHSIINGALYVRLMKKAIEKGHVFSIVEISDEDDDGYNTIVYKANIIGKTIYEVLKLTDKLYNDLEAEVTNYTEDIRDMINDYISK